MSHEEHSKHAPGSVGFALLTVSDTRTMADDASGSLAHEMLDRAGHVIRDYRILKEPESVRAAIEELPSGRMRAIVLSGGTGIWRGTRRSKRCRVF
jgi:molybdenum cofactor biosynthesis protein B